MGLDLSIIGIRTNYLYNPLRISHPILIFDVDIDFLNSY